MKFNYRVYYEDTDAGGVVYYANYLKFFERARTDFLRAKNIFQSDLMHSEKLAFVVKRCEIDYLKPAKLDDLIEVEVIVKEIKSASFKIEQKITINDIDISRLKVEIVSVDCLNFRVKKIPDNLKKLINV
jgi:acyl-CoA thioester hydrolase